MLATRPNPQQQAKRHVIIRCKVLVHMAVDDLPPTCSLTQALRRSIKERVLPPKRT